MAKNIVRNDLTSNGAGDLIITKIVDNTYGATAETYKDFLISLEHATTATSSDFTTGTNNDIPMTSAESDDYTLTVNGFNPEFHALLTGREVKTTNIRGMHTLDAMIQETGTDPNFKYTYVLPVDAPAPIADNNYYQLFIVDDAGHSLQQVAVGETVEENQYTYDNTTKTITVHAMYKDTTLTLRYFAILAEGFETSSSEVISRPEFQIAGISPMQAVKGGDNYSMLRVIERAKLTGDYNNFTSQKDANNNITYTLSAQTAPIGKDKFTESIWKI